MLTRLMPFQKRGKKDHRQMRRFSSLATSTACRLAVVPAAAATLPLAVPMRSSAVASSSRLLKQQRFYSSNVGSGGDDNGTHHNKPASKLPYYKQNREDLESDVHKMCHDLIRTGRVVVFLTGTPEDPRCGFTRALVSILDQMCLKFNYVDIMESEAICEGLKVYSGWPTYPQVYIDAELIGGYDVIKEMCLSGEFPKMLSEKRLLEAGE